MNKYETIILVEEKSIEEERNEVLNKIKTLISENGKINKVEELGLKKLTYEIRKNTKAYYYVINFKSEPDFIYELERFYRITDEIIKFITIRIES